MDKPTIYFFMYDDMEVLDFTGPFDVFSMATGATRENRDGVDVEVGGYHLKTVSETGETVRAIHNLRIEADMAMADVHATKSDMVMIPGGVPKLMPTFGKDHPDVMTWIQRMQSEAGIMATVCLGAIIAAQAGLFKNQEVTTHHGGINLLKDITKGQGTTVIPGARYVDNGKDGGPQIISSAGVSAGMDMAFYLLNQHNGAALARKTANIMEYNGTHNWVFG